MFKHHHLRVPNFSQIHTVTVTHLFWGWCHLKAATHRVTQRTRPYVHGANAARELCLPSWAGPPLERSCTTS